ncbi:hypothetical protein DCAR_0830698 [Daucus carota subsp. sativus]|uniref:Fluoride ion transporter CrcB n=1 Tax=Daucus carota subsp. sativus TaxID=79200 RepID=A0AAF0XND6_DAUCS|nr:PREDICTED: UPF0695 membrane protein C977.11/PB8B6.06c isoform X1 [Daucus carota subsp. sativus]WOH11218.1 hypothetical protein DCAR_0830698 [Daucus carota subsp. sativus]
MDCTIIDSQLTQSACFGQSNRVDSSLRRRSLPQLGDDTDSESVSEAGDIGDRALSSKRYSGSGRIHFLEDNVSNNNFVLPVQQEAVVHLGSKEQETKPEMPWLLQYISCLVHLAVWGIFGVLTRYLLQKLFGPGIVGATSDQSYMYLDLPSNMVGSFLMGWLGVVFKANISKVSDQLAIGLTTGYLGSLTTFSGWNQKMLDLSVEGQWVFVVLGYFIGLFLVAYSIIFGIETAKGFKWMLKRLASRSKGGNLSSKSNSIVDNYKIHVAALVILILILALLWCLSGVFEKREFSSGNSAAQLWLACMVGPFGVWIRWFLARLNGRGLGKNGSLKWVPFGTLIANVSAACIMAVLAVLKKVVKTQNFDTVASGLQFGLMGCLSTVSTFIAELHAMRQSDQPWRAYAYAVTTICISFSMGTLIYSVPVWIKGYD